MTDEKPDVVRIVCDMPRRALMVENGWAAMSASIVDALRFAAAAQGAVMDGPLISWVENDSTLLAENRLRLVTEVEIRPAP